MEGIPQFFKAFTDFVQGTNWVLPALGLLFVFICIVSKGFRNFVLGLIIMAILIFEGFWFYDRFFSTAEERAELKQKVEEFVEKAQSTPAPKPLPVLAPTQTPPPTLEPTLKPTEPPPSSPTPLPSPPSPTKAKYRLKDRKF